MEAEKLILIDYLTKNGFSKESAGLYVNSLSKKPEQKTDLNFTAILEIIKFTLSLK